jgi:anti-anti-sigma factor
MGVQRSRKTGALGVVQVLLDHMPDSAFAVDPDGRIAYANQSAGRLLGYSADELLTLRATDIMEPSAAERALRGRELRAAGSLTFSSDCRLKGGGGFPVRLTASRAEIGGREYRLLFMHDARAEKQTVEALDRALSESARRQEEVTALLAASRAILGQRELSQAARSIFTACKSLIGATGGYVALLSDDGLQNNVIFLESGGMACTVDPQLPMPIRGLRAEAYRMGEPVYENHFDTSRWTTFIPGGHMVMRNVLFAPMKIHGKAVGLFGLANKPQDFTPEDARIAAGFGELAAIALVNARALTSVERSEGRLRSIVQAANDPIVTADTAGNIVFWNKAAEVVFGYSPEEAIGRPVTMLMPERFRDAHSGALRRAAGQEQWKTIGRTANVIGVRKDGREFPIELSLAAWQSGQESGCTAVLRDITERKRAEEEVRRQQATIRELSTPVLPLVRELLIVPLIGSVDSQRARQLTEQLLKSIRANRARVAVIDVTGVATMDTVVANHLVQAAKGARLLGARVILTGISRAIAHTLVTLGVDLSELRTAGDLQSGIEEGLRLLGYQLNCGGAGRSHAGGGSGPFPDRPGE